MLCFIGFWDWEVISNFPLKSTSSVLSSSSPSLWPSLLQSGSPPSALQPLDITSQQSTNSRGGWGFGPQEWVLVFHFPFLRPFGLLFCVTLMASSQSRVDRGDIYMGSKGSQAFLYHITGSLQQSYEADTDWQALPPPLSGWGCWEVRRGRVMYPKSYLL